MNCNKKSACTKVRELYGNIINWSFFIDNSRKTLLFSKAEERYYYSDNAYPHANPHAKLIARKDTSNIEM